MVFKYQRYKIYVMLARIYITGFIFINILYGVQFTAVYECGNIFLHFLGVGRIVSKIPSGNLGRIAYIRMINRGIIYKPDYFNIISFNLVKSVDKISPEIREGNIHFRKILIYFSCIILKFVILSIYIETFKYNIAEQYRSNDIDKKYTQDYEHKLIAKSDFIPPVYIRICVRFL